MTLFKQIKIAHFLVALLALLSSKWVLAFSAFVVDEIKVEGLQRMELGAFYNLLPLKVGETLDETRVPLIIRTLYASNSFEDIRLFRDGNMLMIDVLERPTISDITIEGNSDIDSEQILEALRKSGFAKGEIYDPSAILGIKGGIQDQYFSHGKYSVKVEDKIIKQSRNRVYIKFVINEGEPARIQRLAIIGNQVFDEQTLLDQFELSIGGMFSFFSSDDQYSREKLSGDLEKLRSYYMDRGYLKFENTSTQVSISPDRKGIYITINIEEGQKFTVNKVVFSGDLILTKDYLEQMMPLNKGDTYSAAAISFVEEQIKNSLGVFGYAFAKVVTVPKLNEADNSVDLTLFIEPGKKVYINRVNVAGNESTNDEVLRREVRLMEGGALSTNAVERSKVRLQRLPYIEEVKVETPKSEEKEDRVDIVYEVKERSAGTVSGGIGYSDFGRLSLNANVSHSNFMGSGKQVQFAINKSRFVETYAVNYTDPYFTLDGVSAGAGVSFRETDYSEINLEVGVQTSIGVDFNLGYPLNEVTRLNFGAALSSNELAVSNSYLSEQAIAFYDSVGQDIRRDPNYEYELYRASIGWSRNTLNRGIFPDRGTSQSLMFNATTPGSDLTFYKLDYDLSHYIPIAPGWSFLSSLRASWGDGYGDNDRLPYFENFSAGGSGTMRGFDTNTIGPRLLTLSQNTTSPGVAVDEFGSGANIYLPSAFDSVTVQSRSAGGNARLLGTLELIFPVPFVEEANSVRTSAFIDVGNLWDTHFNREQYAYLSEAQYATIPDYSDPNNYRVSAGISLQWLSPMGPLTISFSRVLKKEDDDRTESFSFNVGKTF